MSSENSSFEESGDDDNFSPKNSKPRVTLRQREQISYREKKYEDLDQELDEEINSRPTRTKKSRDNYKKIIAQNHIDDDEMDEEDQENDEKNGETNAEEQQQELELGQTEMGGIFYPEIDQILFRREKKNNPQEFEYLVKYKDWSYLHVDWLDEKDVIVDSQTNKNKLNRFNKAFDRKLAEGEIDEEVYATERWFDPTFIDVDRILHTTELFPVIHPKKANEIKGKWSESLVLVINKLLNFSKDTVHYGVHFAEPVNPERDGCPNYKKIISNPQDLGSILNRIYLDYYQNPVNVWVDLGFVFKNSRKYNKDVESDIRILCDTLRECAVQLYKQWHGRQKAKYEQLLHKYKMNNDTQYKLNMIEKYVLEFTCYIVDLKNEDLNNFKKVITLFEDQKQDESQSLYDQLLEFVQINKEKENSQECCTYVEKQLENQNSLKYLNLKQIKKCLGFEIKDDKTEEEEKKLKEEKEKMEVEEAKKKRIEEEKLLTKEQQKELHEKKKQTYKGLIVQLTPEQKQKLQADLNAQYKANLQKEIIFYNHKEKNQVKMNILNCNKVLKEKFKLNNSIKSKNWKNQFKIIKKILLKKNKKEKQIHQKILKNSTLNNLHILGYKKIKKFLQKMNLLKDTCLLEKLKLDNSIQIQKQIDYIQQNGVIYLIQTLLGNKNLYQIAHKKQMIIECLTELQIKNLEVL